MLVIMPEYPASLIALTIPWSHSMQTDSKPSTLTFFGYNICTTPAVCVPIQGGGDENGLPAGGDRI